jgi:hypothetical protein
MSPFKVTCDECAVTLELEVTFRDLKSPSAMWVAVNLTPQTARALAQDLLEAAQDCEDANEHELEQMA